MFFREWFVVFFSVCFVGMIFFAQSFSCKIPSLSLCVPLQPPKVDVLVSGAVKRPGVYKVDSGVPLQSILDLAGLEKNADKSSLYPQKKVMKSCSLVVPEKKCRKSRKKKRGSSSMAPVSYTNENGRNLSKSSENICSWCVSRNF